MDASRPEQHVAEQPKTLYKSSKLATKLYSLVIDIGSVLHTNPMPTELMRLAHRMC